MRLSRRTPLPKNWGEWSPLAKELWHIIDAPRFDRAAFDDAIRRHAPEIVEKSARSLAKASGTSSEADYYSLG